MRRKNGRFDFEFEVVSHDEENRTVEIRLIPDSRRYEEVEFEGVRHYKDKYLDTLIPFSEMVAQMGGLPIFHLSSSIDSTQQYALRRIAAVTRELAGGQHEPPPEKAIPHRDYKSEVSRDISFLSVDICGGTGLRRRDESGFEKAYKVFTQELGTLVGQFNGSILKTTGDGFIAYIDHPSFTSQCDATIDLGLSFLVILRDTVNPALIEAGIAPLSIRVGADFGPATTRTMLIPSTSFQTLEVASDALNRAVKIQESGAPGTFRIGRELYELIHVRWLERATEVSFDDRTVGVEAYRVYEIR